MAPRIIDRLVEHILDTPYEAFTEDVIEAAKMRLIDALGCTVSGAGGAGNDAVLQVVRALGGAPQASLVASGEKLALPYAAMINSLQSRSFDFEVCGPEPEGVNAGKMVGHVASTTEPTALNVGEFMHSSGRELLAAVILGGDVAARVSVANTFNFDADFEVCGTSNAFGAAAVAGRLMGLTSDQLRNAFGILLNLMAGSYQGIWDGVPSFKLPGAMAAFNGILSCQLSVAGFDGVRDALESRLGYFSLYTDDPHPDAMTADLGDIFYVRGQHKMHPSCYGNHNPIDCALEVRAEHGFAGDDVAQVYLDVLPQRIDHFLNQVPGPDDLQPKFLFSIPYGVANALYRGRPELEHYSEPAIRDPRILDLASRVVLRPNLPSGKTHAIRLTIILKDGRELEFFRENPVGWLDDPVGYDDVVAKYWRNVRFNGALPQEQAESALELIHKLEDVPDVAELAKQLSL
ncbi:MmgE/PrpD family protein [Arthrobacter sp. APC 3897]|uniref:MmgE/PrpD family protein n=1 Tax=Arthrobacter sp. APC 3897 TaxID=3035204 RepID=UPI0025B417DE|nr:MmgE/PrpD family protein [Arthrobacter sp. APC 3897]MDN3482378.1 MmgE/PrpD family protein [Arthrobacter sp. APC 3897]